MSKYHAIKTEVDGIVFASKKEAKRYGELKLLQRAGEISGLDLQPSYPLVVSGQKICTYKADFRYVRPEKYGPGTLVVEDVKGMKTPVYRLKKKLLKACYGIEVKET